MLKYATAIRVGTASTEAILRRFMKANATHPTYQAMIELGRAQKTTFLARIQGTLGDLVVAHTGQDSGWVRVAVRPGSSRSRKRSSSAAPS